MDYKKYIIDSIGELSGKYNPYQVFTDWIAMSALSISNSCQLIHNKIYQDREQKYIAIAKKYDAEELKVFGNMTGALALVLEENMSDVLGEIYMKAGCGSKATGQFFTPYHLSYVAAKLCYENQFSQNATNDEVEINEPSTGGGGKMIAICQVAKESGLDYQRKIHITAQDLDWNGVYMTYVQLSLLGAQAIVVQGDTLIDPYHRGYDESRVFRTPAEMGAII